MYTKSSMFSWLWLASVYYLTLSKEINISQLVSVSTPLVLTEKKTRTENTHASLIKTKSNNQLEMEGKNKGNTQEPEQCDNNLFWIHEIM